MSSYEPPTPYTTDVCLLWCPCCGGHAKTTEADGMYRIECKTCHMTTRPCASRNEAVELWQPRIDLFASTAKMLRDDIKTLKEGLDSRDRELAILRPEAAKYRSMQRAGK